MTVLRLKYPKIDGLFWLNTEIISVLQSQDSLTWVQEALWTKFDIEQGLPTLTDAMQSQHIPQCV